MFHKTWFRALLVLTVLASLIVSPLLVSAQDDVNGITAPADGATVSGTVTVTGYADDANFKRWDLFVFPGGDDSAKIWIASGNTAGEFSVDVDTVRMPDGDHTFVLRVVTNPRQNYTEYTSSFTLANAEAPAAAVVEEEVAVEEEAVVEEEVAVAEVAETAAPVNGLVLEDGATLSGMVDVTGYADDANFKRWDLFIFLGGDEDAKTWVASGSTAGELSVALDTTLYPNGEHTFSLRVVTNPRQNYTEYTTPFVIANAE